MLLVRSKPQVLFITNRRGLNKGFTHWKVIPSTQLKKRYVSYVLICNIYVLKTITIFNYAELLKNSLLWKILFITFFFVKAFVSSPMEMGNTGDAAWSWGPLCTKYKQKVSEEMSQWCLHRLIYLDKSTGTRVIKIVLR